jgi:2'-5' RNA ligase
MSIDDSINETSGVALINEAAPSSVQKTHCMTVCMVPPAMEEKVWERLTEARTELKDPGLFRWPPHVNLIYPFVDISKESLSVGRETDCACAEGTTGTQEEELESARPILEALVSAVQKCKPFYISLKNLGTFGGKHRGVLYMYPSSSWEEDSALRIPPPNTKVDTTTCTPDVEPLVQLQSILQEQLPEFPDQVKNGKFTPHITLSHFPSLEEALEAQTKLESWWQPLQFKVEELHVLKRVGDDGQFKIVCTLPLGTQQVTHKDIVIHDPTLEFPAMPLVEEDWVYEERMKMKARRNGGRRSRRGGRRLRTRERRERGPSRTRDTPEVIAQKRAERAAKRERLERETLQ